MSFYNYNTLSTTLISSAVSPLSYSESEYLNIPFHYYDEESSEERINYVSKVQDWLDEKDINTNETNRKLCSLFYNELIDTIHKHNYNIRDINQFKEDIIHYLYTLSDLDKNEFR